MNTQWQRSRRTSRGLPSLGTVASAAVIAYGTYRLASWAWNTWYGEHDEQQQQQLQTPQAQRQVLKPQQWRHRRQRLARCREEAMKAIHGFLPTLRRAVEDRTSTVVQSQSLKQLRSQRDHHQQQQLDPSADTLTRQTEKELWEIIKIKSVTRMVATAYAHSILFLVVTVQVNLLGGKLFEEQWKDDTNSSMDSNSVASERMEAYSASHKLVLQHTYQYFFDQGMDSLVASVERATQQVLEHWNVSDASSLNITKESFDQAIRDIRSLEEQGRISSNAMNTPTKRPRSLLRFLLPLTETLQDNFNSTGTVTDELARWILDETWDLLESPILLDAQRDCLACTFAKMRDEHWGKIFDMDARELPRHAANPTVTRPLAYVVTRLKHTSKSFFKSTSHHPLPAADDRFFPVTAMPGFMANEYCAAMEQLPSVLELADVSFN